ncbi:hydra actinoporin-like toxin 3 isoform X1 [Alligator mississippiensis]|uniref:hydra actinoporin-like toxin 3 n=1 Tax=Alligator mississippiensis TaxID=8496 RepID=UPI002877C818|nr:hydra actinoporin-like toxin 3 [Alligator mississippiensis]XP_059574506.1 hydra actinoporin-like toxin 3 isoform X1 [Alligator mississippiensis]
MADTIQSLVATTDVGRCVGIEIINQTQNLTLHSPRYYCFSGHSLIPPVLKITPGSTANCVFVKTRYSLRGSVGILAYEAGDFILALVFSNPFDYVLYNIQFALSITDDKYFYDSMEAAYYRIIKNSFRNSTSIQKVSLSQCHETVKVTARNISAQATMSNDSKAILRVLIETDNIPHPFEIDQ